MDTLLERMMVVLEANGAQFDRALKSAESTIQNSAVKIGATAGAISAGVTAAFSAIENTLKGSIGTMIDLQRQYDVTAATLRTATGSVDNAKEAFKALEEYAYFTPFAIKEVTEAFIELRNYGLDPSEAALTSYGNTASALGVSLSRMTSAVSAATAGNFESLRGLGIRAMSTGTEVKMTFQGISTTIRNNARDIEAYLQKIGNVNFAGAMKERIGTLDDTILAVSENWKNLLLHVSQSGFGDVLKDQIQVVVDILKSLDAAVQSNQAADWLEVFMLKMQAFGIDFENMAVNLTAVWDAAMEYVTGTGKGASEGIIQAFLNIPENIRTVVQLITAYQSGLLLVAWEVAKGVYDTFVNSWKAQWEIGKEIWGNIFKLMNPLTFAEGATNVWQKSVKVVGELGSQVKDTYNKVIEQSKFAVEGTKATVDGLLRERDERIRLANLLLEQGKIKRQQWLEEQERLKADRLARYKIEPETLQDMFNTLEKSSRSALDKTLESVTKYSEVYDMQLGKNIISTELYQARVRELLSKSSKYVDQYEGMDHSGTIEANNRNQLLVLEKGFEKERESVNKAYEDMRKDAEAGAAAMEDAMSDAFIYGEDDKWEEAYLKYEAYNDSMVAATERRTALMGEMEANYVRQSDLLMRQHEAASLMRTASVFGQAAGLAEQMAGLLDESSSAGKAFFIASKALAIAQAMINTQVAYTRALAEGGFFLGIPMATAIAALGYASVGIIAAQTIASFEGGGATPSGPRSGGMDGKGGFLAMLHPDEKVRDLRKDGEEKSGGNTYIIDARGVDESVVDRLEVLLYQMAGPGVTEQRSVSAVLGSKGRGGSVGRGL